jgi:hypothetical protein
MGAGRRFRKEVERGLTNDGVSSSNAEVKELAKPTRRCVHIDMMVTSAVERPKTTWVRMLRRTGAIKGML